MKAPQGEVDFDKDRCAGCRPGNDKEPEEYLSSMRRDGGGGEV